MCELAARIMDLAARAGAIARTLGAGRNESAFATHTVLARALGRDGLLRTPPRAAALVRTVEIIIRGAVRPDSIGAAA